MADLKETVAHLLADIKELRSLIANGSGNSGEDGEVPATSASSLMAWYEHATMDIVMKSIVTVAVIIGLVAIDFM